MSSGEGYFITLEQAKIPKAATDENPPQSSLWRHTNAHLYAGEEEPDGEKGGV